MATDAHHPGASPASDRNARGEWRPAAPIRYAPLFQWPMHFRALLKWLFGWPGFLWPVNLSLLLISAVSWYLTQPDLTRCTHF